MKNFAYTKIIPTVVVGWMEFFMDAKNKRNNCCARLDIWDESPITLEGELKLIVLERFM